MRAGESSAINNLVDLARSQDAGWAEVSDHVDTCCAVVPQRSFINDRH